MPSARKIQRSPAQIAAINETATVVKQTLADAIAACLAGDVAVGNDIEWRERTLNLGRGGNVGTLMDSGDSELRPTADNGNIIWVGSAGLYLFCPFDSGTVTPFQFGAISGQPAQQTAIQAAEDFAYNNGMTVDFNSDKEWLISTPLFKRSDSKWINGTIHNTNSSGSMNSICVVPGTFHPIHFDINSPLGVYTRFPLNAISGGDTIELTDTADADGFSVGELVWIIANASFIGAAGNEYPVYAHLSKVIDIEAGVIQIETPISVDVSEKHGSASLVHAEESGVSDYFGQQLYFCKNAKIEGMTLISDTGSALQRGGIFECDFSFKSITAANGVFLNAICDSVISVTSANIFRKVCDVAGFSQRSSTNINSVTYINKDGVSEDSALVRIGECSEDSDVNIGTAKFDSFAYPSALATINAGAKSCDITIGKLSARTFSQSALTIQQSVISVGTQITVEDCFINTLKATFGSLVRGLWINDAAGPGTILRCGSRNLGIVEGVFSAYSALSGGTETQIHSPASKGRVGILTGAILSKVSGYFEDGYYCEEPETVITVTSKNLMSKLNGKYRSTVVTNVNSVTPNNVLKSFNFPAATFVAGDRFKIRLMGEFVGTAGVKQIQLTDADSVLYSFSSNAGDVGNFELEITVIVQSLSRITVVSKLIYGGTFISDVIDSGFSAASSQVFNIEAWLADSADTIRIHGFESKVEEF